MEQAYLKTLDNEPVVNEGCYTFLREGEEDIIIPTEMCNISLGNFITVCLPDNKEVQLMFQSDPHNETDFFREAHEKSPVLDDEEQDGNLDTRDVYETKWGNAETRQLIELYKTYKPLVGRSAKLKTKAKLWSYISQKLGEMNYVFTPLQVCNKWKTLERRYKDATANNKKTGRAPKRIPFETELLSIFGKQAKIFPVATLDSNEGLQERENIINNSTLDENAKAKTLESQASSSQNVRAKDGKTAQLLNGLQMQMKSTNELMQQLIEQRTRSNDLKEEKNALLKEYISLKRKVIEMRSKDCNV